jgi:hypothetical protein
MLFTIVAIWAVVIPVAVLAISWGAPDRREVCEVQTNELIGTGKYRSAPPRAQRTPTRPSRAAARRVCPDLGGDARRRPASA